MRWVAIHRRAVVRLLVASMASTGLLNLECAAQYPSPTTPKARSLEDYRACLEEAELVGKSQRFSMKPIVVTPPSDSGLASNDQDPRGSAAIARNYYEAQLFESCMANRGYRLKP